MKNNKKKVNIEIGKLIYLRDCNEYGGVGKIVDYFPKGYFSKDEIIEVRCSKIDETVYFLLQHGLESKTMVKLGNILRMVILSILM